MDDILIVWEVLGYWVDEYRRRYTSKQLQELEAAGTEVVKISWQ